MSIGRVYGKVSTDNSFIPLCLNTQFTIPLFADSIASSKTVRMVSGMFDASDSWKIYSSLQPLYNYFTYLGQTNGRMIKLQEKIKGGGNFNL